MYTILGMLLGLLMVGFIFELSAFGVIGPWVKEHRLDSYFSGGRIDRLELNELDKRNNLFYDRGGKFISTMAFPIFSKWYINEIGQIPRWSKWSKVLDEKRKSLINNDIDYED